MKKVVLALTESAYELRYISRFYEKSKEMGIDSDFIYYTYNSDLSNIIPKSKVIVDAKLFNYLKESDHRFYEDYLNFVISKCANAIIPRLIHPEFFYSSIISLKNCPNISLSGYAFELFIRSQSRSNIMKKILELDSISGLLLHTIGGKNAKWPPQLDINKTLKNKIQINTEPLFDSLLKFQGNKFKARKELNICTEKKILLFFGTMYPWKGPETLLNSVEYLEEDSIIIFGGNLNTYKGDPEKLKNPKILLIDKPNDDLMYKLFQAADIVVCPYGPSYSFGTSNVCMSSVLSNKPFICPSVEPFISLIKKYKFGETFSPDNSLSLAKSVNTISKNISFYESQNKKGYEEFVSNIMNWEDIIKFHVS